MRSVSSYMVFCLVKINETKIKLFFILLRTAITMEVIFKREEVPSDDISYSASMFLVVVL